MAQNRVKCSDVFKAVFLGKVNQKADNGGSLHFGGKNEKIDWAEIKNTLYQGPMKVDNAKERKRTGYCKYCRNRYSDIEEHLNGEQHQQYVQNTNFESLDRLINYFPLDNCFPVVTKENTDFSVAANNSSFGDKNLECNSGGCSEYVHFSLSPVEGVVPMEVSDGRVDAGHGVLDDGKGMSYANGNLGGGVSDADGNLGGDVSDVDSVCDAGKDDGRLKEGMRRKFTCPHCNKNVVNLPRHMQTIHGWSMCSSIAVIDQFNMRKKNNNKESSFSKNLSFCRLP